MPQGYVYILTNPCFDAYFKSKIVKIGQAKDVDKRVSTLNTAVPKQFEIYATLQSSKYKIIEAHVHQRLKGFSALKELQGKRRVKAENGEFYLITPAQAVNVVKEVSELVAENDKIFKLYKNKKERATTKKAVQTAAEKWATRGELARMLAQRGGNEGAAGGIDQILRGMRPCKSSSKWRKPLEDVGIKFDDKDMVIDWSVANNPL